MEKCFKAYLELSMKLRDFKNKIGEGCSVSLILRLYTELIRSIGSAMQILDEAYISHELTWGTCFRYIDKFTKLEWKSEDLFREYIERS